MTAALIGQQIEHYRVLQHLGDGGMGTVFRAVDTMLEREVALKVLRTDLSDQPDVARRFRAEAVTLARLSHPHIATLYGLVRHGSQLCMVMELVPGETLAALMQRERGFSWERAARLTVQILSALDYAHASGVIHRDIKPSNVIVSARGTVKVLDFGIARVLDADRLTRQGLVVGTPQYMAPEQIRAADLDGRADVYSVGVMLYEMLAGRLPFRADNDIALMYAHLEGQLVPLAETAPTIPPWLFDVVGRALARTPEGRFASAAVFRDVLEERLPHRPSGASLTALQPSPESEAPTLIVQTGSNPALTPAPAAPVKVTPARATPVRATPAAASAPGGAAPTTPAPTTPTPSVSGGAGVMSGFARLRSWAMSRVTWEYQAGPDGLLTARPALRPRSGSLRQPLATPAALDAHSETTAFPGIDNARRASQWRTGVLVASVLVVGVVVAGATRWFTRPDPPGNGPGPIEKAAAASATAPAAGEPPIGTPRPRNVEPVVRPSPRTPVEGATVKPPAPSPREDEAPPAPIATPSTTPSTASPPPEPAPAFVPPPATASPVAAAPFVPPASLRDEVFEELVLLLPGGSGYEEVEVTATFERDRLLVYDPDEERTVASVRFHGGDGASMTGLPTWLTGTHDWLIVPTTTGRLVLQLDYPSASRASQAFLARTGQPMRRARGELDK